MQSNTDSKSKIGSPASQKKVCNSSPVQMLNNKHFRVKSPVRSLVQKHTGKCTQNVGESGLKRTLQYDKKSHFSCVTTNRFEPLVLNESSCTENDIDLARNFNCSSDKNNLDTYSNKVVLSTGQARALNRKKGSNNKSTQNQDKTPPKNLPEVPIMDDKYGLALQVKNKNKEKLNNAKTDPTYQKWNSQNDDKFGFIPLGPLILPTCDKQIKKGTDPIKLYDITRSQKTFNFLSSQVCVHSQLNHKRGKNCYQTIWTSSSPT